MDGYLSPMNNTLIMAVGNINIPETSFEDVAGLDSVKDEVKVTENGKVYTATRKVTYFGNIPYYVGIAGEREIKCIIINSTICFI